MFIYTVIASENDAVHLSGYMELDPNKVNNYYGFTITFWDIEEHPIRTESCTIEYIWDNVEYMITEIYPMLKKYCHQTVGEYQLPEFIDIALMTSDISPEELLDLIERGIAMDIVNIKYNDPFDQINRLF